LAVAASRARSPALERPVALWPLENVKAPKGKQQPYYKTQCQAINEKAGGQTTAKRSDPGRVLGVRMALWADGVRIQGDTHQKSLHKCTATGALGS